MSLDDIIMKDPEASKGPFRGRRRFNGRGGGRSRVAGPYAGGERNGAKMDVDMDGGLASGKRGRRSGNGPASAPTAGSKQITIRGESGPWAVLICNLDPAASNDDIKVRDYTILPALA